MKKDFKGGLSTILGESKPEDDGGSKSARRSSAIGDVKSTSEIGTKENETRYTSIVRKDLLEGMKTIAYWERLNIKDVNNAALEDYIQRYEKEHGPLKPMPKR